MFLQIKNLCKLEKSGNMDKLLKIILFDSQFDAIFNEFTIYVLDDLSLIMDNITGTFYIYINNRS